MANNIAPPPKGFLSMLLGSSPAPQPAASAMPAPVMGAPPSRTSAGKEITTPVTTPTGSYLSSSPMLGGLVGSLGKAHHGTWDDQYISCASTE
mmetsp:Transcript_57580/g.182381  ORF Transcript_57580/g.182381 Transcript_57580/m.182381 type:complete len:93 (-) Transcript_57580:153-431(-)|eukprot:CAMPEP_0182866462 /NCGR_PEP_ID=MMETSP0034_2-20130328/8218_1 /TAXON_ID=156128 /ORGANISM="Nephroselmis pyriformis, Strain CCMP717" /LENGTH=92 /DNA_ID=CAMNT_0024998789 /DNA_START=138 /DNA_END=416 /DNA_ORIENTATION=-